MKLQKDESGDFRLHLTEQQLLAMFSCMRESIAALDKRAFEARVGFSLEVVSRCAQDLMGAMEEAGVEL